MREIVLDTETTGLDPEQGDRIVEIGAVELWNHLPTGKTFHKYLNPERSMPAEAFAVHGLSDDFLKDKPLFAAVCDPFLEFIGNAPLVAHNAMFDFGFINAELARLSKPLVAAHRIVDTLQLARRKHPAGPNSLDALCKRYGIDNTKRTKHGALMDAALLAQVYVELLGERQASLGLAERGAAQRGAMMAGVAVRGARPTPLPQRLTQELIAAHRAFVATLGPKALWNRYLAPSEPS